MEQSGILDVKNPIHIFITFSLYFKNHYCSDCWISYLLHQTSGVLVSKAPLHVGGHVLGCSAILYVLHLCAE